MNFDYYLLSFTIKMFIKAHKNANNDEIIWSVNKIDLSLHRKNKIFIVKV